MEVQGKLGNFSYCLDASVKPSPTRDFSVRVTPQYEDVPDDSRGLAEGIIHVKLNWSVDVTFIPFESAMAPPFPADITGFTAANDWNTAADARLETFFNVGLAVTAYDPLAGQEVLFPSDQGAPNPGSPWYGEPWERKDGVVFYTTSEHYRALESDLAHLLETHQERNFDERALDLQDRPVIKFLVDRLQTSRLVPDDVLHWLGLQRTVAA